MTWKQSTNWIRNLYKKKFKTLFSTYCVINDFRNLEIKSFSLPFQICRVPPNTPRARVFLNQIAVAKCILNARLHPRTTHSCLDHGQKGGEKLHPLIPWDPKLPWSSILKRAISRYWAAVDKFDWSMFMRAPLFLTIILKQSLELM